MKNWTLTYSDYKPESELLREALLTLGNGYFCTRGAAEESRAGERHYPGTYLAGGYNRLRTEISGKMITNEDLVNWPDWTLLKFKTRDGQWLDLEQFHIKEYKQELDVKNGILKRTVLYRDEKQRETELVSQRFVSMCHQHIAGIQWKLTPKNWSGSMVIHSALDGTVVNNGVERYRDLQNKHLKILDREVSGEDRICIKAQTVQSEIIMAQAARTTVSFDEYETSISRETIKEDQYIAQELEFDVEENKPVWVEKMVAVYTSRDNALSEPVLEAKKAVKRAGDFETMKAHSSTAWQNLWEKIDVELETDDDNDQLLLRLHIFHLLQTYSYHSADHDVGAPARGWHGEAYRGHIFWDELFIFPFFNANAPELSRSLLLYRYRRLEEARYAAKEEGYEGAMFPWQSGSNGREESQVIHLNPKSGNWIPDETHLQRHVNSAIAYNLWNYFETTGDLRFLANYGAEMLLDIAKFWASKVIWNADREKYEIHGIVGPDEYHTSYPDSDEPGLKNNAYTNVMAVWVLLKAKEALDNLDAWRVEDLKEKLDIQKEDLDRWDKITRNMYIPFIRDGKIIEQFEGFDSLKDLDWEHYHEKYGEILRLDRILEEEGDEVNRYKASKQADVFMLFYLFSLEEMQMLFNRMGYDFDEKQIPKIIDYYEKLTSHGSTLSKLVHSWVYARSRREKSWHNFEKALISDFKDVQGGTTHEGIHLGAMVGTVHLIVHCYTGLRISGDTVSLNPKLPENIKRIRFRFHSKGQLLELNLVRDEVKLRSLGGTKEKTKIVVNKEKYTLENEGELNISF